MIYMLLVLNVIFLVILGLFIKNYIELKELHKRQYNYTSKRLDELETYGYTDIRELNDYLNRVDKYLKERGVIND